MTGQGQQKRSLPWLYLFGVALAVVSVGITIYLGIAATKNDSLPVVFAILAAVTQFASAWLFSSHRKADPKHAKTIVRNMATLAGRLAGLVDDIEKVQEKRNPSATAPEIRQALGAVNVALTSLADDAAVIIESWRDFDAKTLDDLGIDVRSNEINGPIAGPSPSGSSGPAPAGSSGPAPSGPAPSGPATGGTTP